MPKSSPLGDGALIWFSIEGRVAARLAPAHIFTKACTCSQNIHANAINLHMSGCLSSSSSCTCVVDAQVCHWFKALALHHVSWKTGSTACRTTWQSVRSCVCEQQVHIILGADNHGEWLKTHTRDPAIHICNAAFVADVGHTSCSVL